MFQLVCPYCYDSFHQRDIWFRCTGRASRQGKRCGTQRDDLLTQRVGRADALPPAFQANGRKTKVVCPSCGDETTYRICPACHSQLPVHFGKVTSRLIAMVGAKDTGKTVYITVLIHELMNQLGTRFNASVVGCDDYTRSRFTERRERLYQGRKLPDTTTTAQARDGVVPPWVFRLTTSTNGFGRPVSRHSLLSFFDTAGEDLLSRESVDRNARYLASADGIILLLDPLQMPGARKLAAPGTKLPAEGPLVERPDNVLSRITDLLQATSGQQPRFRIKKPIAVAFSKIDTLAHTFSDGSPLRRAPSAVPAFDAQDSMDVHAHVQALLHQWEGAQIDQFLQHHYATYRYFGLSALGETPTDDNRVSARGVRPYRVPDPFLWLLSEFGTIPATRA